MRSSNRLSLKKSLRLPTSQLQQEFCNILAEYLYPGIIFSSEMFILNLSLHPYTIHTYTSICCNGCIASWLAGWKDGWHTFQFLINVSVHFCLFNRPSIETTSNSKENKLFFKLFTEASDTREFVLLMDILLFGLNKKKK